MCEPLSWGRDFIVGLPGIFPLSPQCMMLSSLTGDVYADIWKILTDVEQLSKKIVKILNKWGAMYRDLYFSHYRDLLRSRTAQ